jgi:hypothetical protein
MTKFAPVGPLVAHRALEEAGELGDYQLLIAPMIIRQMEAYRHFFTVDQPKQHVILDNGVVELGYPLPLPDLYTAARTVNANVVVIPDTINDAKMTIKQARTALPAWRQLTPQIKALGVVQGLSFEECIECARILVEEGVDWLGVSKFSFPSLGSRVELVRALGDSFGLPMHILGFTNNLRDDMMAATCHPMVQGIDAATPVWSRKQFKLVPPTDEEIEWDLGRRPKDFWTAPAAPHAAVNARIVRHWLSIASELNGAPVVPTPPLVPVVPTET